MYPIDLHSRADRSVRLVTTTVALILLLAIVAACGNGAETRRIERADDAGVNEIPPETPTEVQVIRLSLTEYSRNLYAAVADFGNRLDPNGPRYGQVSTHVAEANTLTQVRAAGADFMRLFQEDVDTLYRDIEQLAGPAQFSAKHQDCLSLISEVAEAIENSTEQIKASSSISEVDAQVRSATRLASSMRKIGPGSSGACDLLLRALDEALTPQPTDTPRPTVSLYDLSLISASCTQSAGSFIRCEGFVENISGHTLDNVEVVVTFLAGDTPVASDSALIDYQPLLPEQQSPWTAIATYNPAYTGWRVEFKEFFGGSIPMRDDR